MLELSGYLFIVCFFSLLGFWSETPFEICWDLFYGPVHSQSLLIFCTWLKTVCILQLLGRMLHLFPLYLNFELCCSNLLYPCFVFFYVWFGFLWQLLIIILALSFFSCSSVNFFFVYFEVMLLSSDTFIIVLSSCKNEPFSFFYLWLFWIHSIHNLDVSIKIYIWIS